MPPPLEQRKGREDRGNDGELDLLCCHFCMARGRSGVAGGYYSGRASLQQLSRLGDSLQAGECNMERRDFFSLMAASGGMLGASALGIPEARANWGMVAPGPVPGHDFDGRLLVNKARAYEIMDREGLDGIVALNPVNIFYLGNYLSYELQKLRAIPSFAVMPRDEKQPSFLVAAGADLMFLANGDREYPEIVPYSFPVDIERYIERGDWSQEPAAAPVGDAGVGAGARARARGTRQGQDRGR
jgi:hypothetical protein